MQPVTRHFVIIDPACRHPELDAFNRLSQLSQSRFSYHLPALFGMSSLEDLEYDIDAIIIFGSGASVYDKLDWQESLSSWLERVVAEKIPTLGLCYGHQLLAHLLGGKVGFVRNDQQKLVGLRQVTMKKAGFWGEQDGQFRWVVSHRECVQSLPDKLEIIADSAEIYCDGFQHCDLPIWGVQAHPEAGPGFVRNQGIPLCQRDQGNFVDGSRFMQAFIRMIETNAPSAKACGPQILD